MSDHHDTGPVMFAATSVLRGHKTRIGKITGTVSLPRTIPLVNLVAAGIGIIIGLLAAAIVHPSFNSFMWGAGLFGTLGVLLVTYSPLQGESMLKWIGVTVAAKRQEVKIDGKPVRVAIGVAYISEPARGSVHIVPGAVDVNPDQFDERGVLISEKNRNLPSRIAPRRTSRQLAVANDAYTHPPVHEVPVEPRRSRKPGKSPSVVKPGRPAAAGRSRTAAVTDGRRHSEVLPPTSRFAAARAAAAAAAALPAGETEAHFDPATDPEYDRTYRRR